MNKIKNEKFEKLIITDNNDRILIYCKGDNIAICRYKDMEKKYIDFVVGYIKKMKKDFDFRFLPFEGNLKKIREFLIFKIDEDFCS